MAVMFSVSAANTTHNYEVLIYAVDYQWATSSHNEWACYVHADLFDNRHYVAPQPGFQYEWWLNMGQGWFQSGGNTDVIYRDGNMGDLYQTYVVLSVGTQIITSDTIWIGATVPWDLYADTEVEVDQKRENNSAVGDISLRRSNQFWWYPAPWTTRLDYGANYLMADTLIYPNPNEKYHDWENEQNIKNYHRFLIDSTTDLLIANLDITDSAMVKTKLLSGGSGGSVRFKDPWLRDSTSSIGILNRGMDAVWHDTGPLLNLSPDSAHQGVFLNQDPEFDPDIPNYTVRAPQTQVIPFHGQDITWYFKGWDGNGVAYQHPNQTETPVVFQQSNAIATEKYIGRRHSLSVTSGLAAPTAPSPGPSVPWPTASPTAPFSRPCPSPLPRR